jgi:hypothetical protein
MFTARLNSIYNESHYKTASFSNGNWWSVPRERSVSGKLSWSSYGYSVLLYCTKTEGLQQPLSPSLSLSLSLSISIKNLQSVISSTPSFSPTPPLGSERKQQTAYYLARGLNLFTNEEKLKVEAVRSKIWIYLFNAIWPQHILHFGFKILHTQWASLCDRVVAFPSVGVPSRTLFWQNGWQDISLSRSPSLNASMRDVHVYPAHYKSATVVNQVCNNILLK